MTVTTTLARWSRKSNRRRFVETTARILPWLAAFAVLGIYAYERKGWIAAAIVGAIGAIAVGWHALRLMRRVRHKPQTIARVLDRQHHTFDLLQTAHAIESRGAAPEDPLEQLVLVRAGEVAPRLDKVAVAPLKLRSSPLGALGAMAACALLFLTGAGAPPIAPAAPTNALGERQQKQAQDLAHTLDDLAKDPSIPSDLKAQLERAKEALNHAATAKTGKEALAALSEAQRLLDEAAPQLAKLDDTSKLTTQQLADKMASAAKAGDGSRLAQLAKEAMHRAAASPADAQQLSDAMAAAAAAAASSPESGDPWSGSKTMDPSSPEAQRLAALSEAAKSMKSGDMTAAGEQLGELAKSSGMSGSSDPRASRLASARDAIASMRAAERAALNGMSPADARAEAARASGMRPGGRPGSRPGSMGSMMGLGRMPGMGKPGMGMRPGMGRPGMGPGMRPPPGATSGISLLTEDGPRPPGGAAGSSGAHGGTTPSGATEPPETVMSEEVDPGKPMSADGIIRAIAEHSAGDHRSVRFDAVRDHYEAIAEAAIHRDEIPLTRRDFIQRYFEALRTHDEDQ